MPEQSLVNQQVTYPDSKPNELDMEEDMDTAAGHNHFSNDLMGNENIDADMSCIDGEDKEEEHKQQKHDLPEPQDFNQRRNEDNQSQSIINI